MCTPPTARIIAKPAPSSRAQHPSGTKQRAEQFRFEPRCKRAIHVDMRYLGWLLAKAYPAPHLLAEMNFPMP
jgi:hypothetical protein